MKRAKLTPQNTKRANAKSEKLFTGYLAEKGVQMDFATVSKEDLNAVLCKFYVEVRPAPPPPSSKKPKKDYYKTSSLENYRHGLKRMFTSEPYNRTFDIVKDPAFSEANKAFETAMLELKVRINNPLHLFQFMSFIMPFKSSLP